MRESGTGQQVAQLHERYDDDDDDVKALSVENTATDDNYQICAFTFNGLYAGSCKQNIKSRLYRYFVTT